MTTAASLIRPSGRFRLPGPGDIAARTASDRDRAIDVLRILSLAVVIAGHGLMLLVKFDETGLKLGNLLGYSKFLQAATWALQVLPLFFFAGAAASARGCNRRDAWGTWLFRRAQRLYRPVFYYLAFWLLIGIPLIRITLPDRIADPVLGTCVQLLWFIGAYVLVLSCLPLLARIRTARHLWVTVGSFYVMTGFVDVVRLEGHGDWLGLTNFLWVWLIPAALGVGYWRNLIKRGSAAAWAVVLLAVDVSLAYGGPYELSMVGIDEQRLSNMAPPSLLLAGHCLVLCLLAVAVAPWLNAWAQGARVWWVVSLGNSGAMTLYLWHLPALMIVFGASHAMGQDRSDPQQPGFIPLLVVQMIAFLGLTLALFVLLLPLENTPLPLWDGDVAPGEGWRSPVAGLALTLAGVGTLLMARFGLTPTGAAMVASVVALLLLARAALARPGETVCERGGATEAGSS